MFGRVLERMREKVRTRQYVMTVHANEEMDDDALTILDVENGILFGEIVRRQRDLRTGEWKYLIRGPTPAEGEIAVVAKLGVTGTLVIITVYAA